jgi:hypothetical protein
MSIDQSDLLGYAAAVLVFATFYVKSIRALRAVAIASNLMFIAYAISAHLLPVLVLHALLLPLNARRLREALATPSDTEKPEPVVAKQQTATRSALFPAKQM